MSRTSNASLILDLSDPRVAAARAAEAKLCAACGVTLRDREVRLPVDGLRVRVSEYGEGEPLLVVPGNTGDVFPLLPLIARLGSRRIVAINRPGGGLSDGLDHRLVDVQAFAVQTLTAVLDACGLERVAVLAHSMGAHWSLLLAMHAPNRVKALITLGNPGNVLQGKPPVALRLLSKGPLAALLLKATTSNDPLKALRPLRLMGHDPSRLARDWPGLGDCYAAFRQLPFYGVSASSLLANPPRSLGVPELQQVRAPVLMLWGTRDTFATVNSAREMAAAFQQGQLHLIDGAGHLPWLEAAQECASEALRFLDTLKG